MEDDGGITNLTGILSGDAEGHEGTGENSGKCEGLEDIRSVLPKCGKRGYDGRDSSIWSLLIEHTLSIMS
jgi:hypothetical protein